jgi:hypothetical protein
MKININPALIRIILISCLKVRMYREILYQISFLFCYISKMLFLLLQSEIKEESIYLYTNLANKISQNENMIA